MRLKVLSSSSSGNCYILYNCKEALVLECGVKAAEIYGALGNNVNMISGCVITHEHGDHSKYVGQLLKAYITCYSSPGTFNAKGLDKCNLCKAVEPLKWNAIGNFRIMPFKTLHDAAEPYGYIIYHKEMGQVLFATDTRDIPYIFNGLNNILIECNYMQKKLDDNTRSGEIPLSLRKRTMGSHMSYRTCCDILKTYNISQVSKVVLIHLSGRNSEPEEFRKGIEDITHKEVYVARRDLDIEFNKTPF